MTYFTGTLLASPIVRGSSGDTYGTHHSVLGVGGYMEIETAAQRNLLPVDSIKGLDHDGLSSGQRRLGMLVKVLETDSIFELKINYATWTGYTESEKVDALNDNNNWVLANFGGSGSGDRIETSLTQTSHGFVPGDVVGWNDNIGEYEGVLSVTGNTEPLGVIYDIPDSDNFKLCYAGYIADTSLLRDENNNALLANRVYYLSTINPGKLTLNDADSVGEISKPMLSTLTNVDALIFQYRGATITEEPDTPSSNGENISKDVYQVSHGFIVGDAVGYQNNRFETTRSTSEYYDITVGFVTNVISNDRFVVTYSGYVNVFSGLIPNTVYYLSDTMLGGLRTTPPTLIGNFVKPMMIAISSTEAIVYSQRGDIITTISSGSTAGYIGPAEDGTLTGYTDGYYDDFFGDVTLVGTPIDRFNRLFKLLLPEPAPDLSNINSTSSFVSGKLSFGPTRNDISYTNVTADAGNTPSDINDNYSSSGTRLGLIQTSISGVLNSDVVGDPSGIPFLPTAFSNGYKGTLTLELNGVDINVLDLTLTSGATSSIVSNTTLTVSAVEPIKTSTGGELYDSPYRMGTYDISNSTMVDGFNYIKITHSDNSFSNVTNYLEWVYDPENTNITIVNNNLINLSLTGSKHISGVEYNTGGVVQYSATANSVYKNVYSNSSSAISFPNRTNLSNYLDIDIDGSGVVNGLTTSLPNLNSAISNAQDTDIDILATMNITSDRVLGNIGTLGKIESNMRVIHPFTSKNVTGGIANIDGFLIYNVTQGSNFENEDFTGEINRLEARDYAPLNFSNINSGSYNWDSTESLIGGGSEFDSGLLVFNGELMYPNTSYLSSQYGITNGNFANVANTPVGNVNYVTANGIRDYYRIFKSNNTTTQSTLRFEITNTGNLSNFMTDGGIGGTPSVNNIKVEFLIKRSGGQTHGWANPFASLGNPEGIANTYSNHSGNVTTVECTLATIPRVGNGDIIIARIFTSNIWSNTISNIQITNI